jgi:von Willebrand factor type A domain
MKTINLLAGISFVALSFAPAHAATQVTQERVEVAFVLDTTGSMGDLIDGAKRKIWSIASTIVDSNPEADVAFALVAYRDRGDEYVVKTFDLSEDIQGMYGKLTRLQADGGDDTPESVNEALDVAVRDLTWSSGDNVKRIVFLVGDAPPHMDYPQERQYPEIVKAAVKRDIIVNTVQAGDMPETTPVWKEIAQYGQGRYMAIPQSGGEVVVIVSPYDDEILELQGELDRTVVPYGNVEQKSAISQKMAERSAAAPSTQVENSKFYAKRSKKKEVVTGRGDLVADVRNGAVSLDKMDASEMPEELRTQSVEKKKEWVEAKIASREKLEQRMSELMVKRDAFVLKQQAEKKTVASTDSFDRAVEETLKLQLQ